MKNVTTNVSQVLIMFQPCLRPIGYPFGMPFLSALQGLELELHKA